MEEFKFVHGDKVLVHGEARIVDYFDDDTCGDGCCSGYILKGEPNMVYWASDLQLIME